MIAWLVACAPPPEPTGPMTEPGGPETSGTSEQGWTSLSGGQSGSDPGYGPCAEVGEIGPDDVVETVDGPLTGAGARDLADGHFDAALQWDDGPLTLLRADLVWDGVVQELGPGGSTSGCEPGLSIAGRAALVSDDGRLDLDGPATLIATRPSPVGFAASWPEGQVVARVDLAGLHGWLWLADLDLAGSFGD